MGGAAPSGGLSDAHGGNRCRNGARPFCWGGAHVAPGSHPSPPHGFPLFPPFPPSIPYFPAPPQSPSPSPLSLLPSCGAGGAIGNPCGQGRLPPPSASCQDGAHPLRAPLPQGDPSPPLLSPGSPTMLDTISSQYDSFIYWRMPIPRLELAELEGLGLGQGSLYAPHSKLPEAAQEPGCAEEDSLLPFSSFNFWRAPIASISSFDFDLI